MKEIKFEDILVMDDWDIDFKQSQEKLNQSLEQFRISTLQAFIEVEIARLGGEKKEPNNVGLDDGDSFDENIKYNEAISDQISHLKELLITKR